MQTKYFRVSKKEYFHITDDVIFIFNSKEPTRIPLEYDLGEHWGIVSVFNYIVFLLLLGYTLMNINIYGFNFLMNSINYGALFLLFLSFVRIKNGFITSRTPTITRSKIRSVYFKTPKFSYPRLVIYFDGPEGKVLRRTFSVLYKQEALPVLKEAGLLK